MWKKEGSLFPVVPEGSPGNREEQLWADMFSLQWSHWLPVMEKLPKCVFKQKSHLDGGGSLVERSSKFPSIKATEPDFCS